MKMLSRTLTVLTVLLLLTASAAYAEDVDADLYAPMQWDDGAITIEAVTGLPPDAQSPITRVQTVLVILQVPTAFFADVTDLHLDLGMTFVIAHADTYDFYFPANLIRGEADDDSTALTLVFYLPENTTSWDYFFLYLEQIRYLAKTGDSPAPFLAPPAEASETGTTAAPTAPPADADPLPSGFDGVLEALDEPLYSAAYTNLSQGNTIAVDDRSDDAKGLQTLLQAFGFPLTADGWAGGKTFEKLHTLQAVFGLDPSDSLDAEGFQYLLQCLLITRDPALAETLLLNQSMTQDEFTYLLGCSAQYQGHNYTASRYFDDTGWADSEARKTACTVPWPPNGEVYHNPNYQSSRTTLNIEIADQKEGYATYIKIYSQSGDLAAALFAGGSTTVTTTIPGGIYKINAGVGKTWYGPADAFGLFGSYEMMMFNDDATEVTLNTGYDYTLIINTDFIEPEADAIELELIDWEAF